MAIMEASALSQGWLAKLLEAMKAISCFPRARKKSRPPAPQKKQSQCVTCSEPETATTIIVGGGVVGLSIAYWQSRMNKKEREIVVLEARSECFQGASGYNSGLISCHWFSGSLRQLADHSFAIYQELARKRSTGFQDTCDYHENSLFQAHCGEGHKEPRAPYWIKAVDGWHLESEPKMQSLRQEKSDRSKALQDNPSSATM
jgi:glycine/D-amino acid oxidase-like deaminating enzyme